MESVYQLIKVALPNYLRGLPVPKSFDGFGKLQYSDWISLILFLHVVLLIIVALVKLFLPRGPTKINPDIKKDDPKVVDLVEIEDLETEKTAYCRCWKSKKFPLCDGAHSDHNKLTGDNIGPLVVKCCKDKAKAAKE
jgi:CDGSH-type Zn-finger protein